MRQFEVRGSMGGMTDVLNSAQYAIGNGTTSRGRWRIRGAENKNWSVVVRGEVT